MATPTSHPRPSPQKSTTQAGLTPVAASSPPASSSNHSHQRSNITSPAQASKKPPHYRNGSLQQMASPNAGSTPLSRSGTQNGGTPMARTGTNGSVAMARTGTNNSSIGAARTPMAGRTGRTASTSTAAADSPALTALMEGAGKGSGFTPQGLGLTPFGFGGGVMGLAGMNPQDQEEERRRRLETIVETLGSRVYGLASQHGVERCATQAGLECLWEETMGLVEAKRLLSIAGSGVLIEIEFRGDWVVEVGLSFPASREGEDGVSRWARRGAEALKENMRGDGHGYVVLDKFAHNLKWLAKMDELGGDGFSCFDALDGICKSLERLYHWETAVSKFKTDREVHEEILCQRSGRPQMNYGHKFGLVIQYWCQSDIDGDTAAGSRSLHDYALLSSTEALSKTMWSLRVGCQQCAASLYPPVKISDEWVSEKVEKSASQGMSEKHISDTNIDWLQVTDGSSIGKAPDVRFTATFEQHVVVPFELALQIYESVSSPLDPAICAPTSYESLLFASLDLKDPPPSTPRTNERTVQALINSDESSGHAFGVHKYSLYSQQEDYAFTMREIPFSHPMQLISLLPSLRQWILVGSILIECFAPDPAANRVSVHEIPIESKSEQKDLSFQTLEEELADFISSGHDRMASRYSNKKPFEINVALTITPIPRFTVQFRNPRFEGKLASVAFSVALNGAFETIDVDDGRSPTMAWNPGAEGASEMIKLRSRVRKVLEIGKSIPLLVAWLCKP